MSYEETLKHLALADERIIVMTAENRAAIRNLPAVLGDRFIDTGITEQAMVGMAAGLAVRGRIPVCHALATFLTMRAFEFVRTDVGIANLPVKLVGGVAGLLSDGNGPTHQAIEDVALMRGIPPMQVFCPTDAEDLVLAMPQLLTSDAPVYIRHINTTPVIAHESFVLGKAEEVFHGRDITILSYGLLFNEAHATAQRLIDFGLSVRLLNMRMLKPIDEEAVLRAAAETDLLVTIEDHFETGGLFSIVSELLVRNGQMAHVLPIALPDRWFKPALLPDVIKNEGFTPDQLTQRILRQWEMLPSAEYPQPLLH